MKDQINNNFQKFELTNGFYFYLKRNILPNSDKFLLIIPDLTESIEVYDNFLIKLEKNNISTLIFDLPGHGKTSGRRGGYFSKNIYLEIIRKILISEKLKNGIHLYLSGIISPFILKIIFQLKPNFWFRSITISGYNFSINSRFFLDIILNSLKRLSDKLNFYDYIKDKVEDDSSFKKIISTKEFCNKQDFKLLFAIIRFNKIALNLFYENLLPLLIVYGDNQKAFDIDNKIFKKLISDRSLPAKHFHYYGGHSIHLAKNDNVENFLKYYYDFLSIC